MIGVNTESRSTALPRDGSERNKITCFTRTRNGLSISATGSLLNVRVAPRIWRQPRIPGCRIKPLCDRPDLARGWRHLHWSDSRSPIESWQRVKNRQIGDNLTFKLQPVCSRHFPRPISWTRLMRVQERDACFLKEKCIQQFQEPGTQRPRRTLQRKSASRARYSR